MGSSQLIGFSTRRILKQSTLALNTGTENVIEGFLQKNNCTCCNDVHNNNTSPKCFTM